MKSLNTWGAYEAARKKTAKAAAIAREKAVEAKKAATKEAQDAAKAAERETKNALDKLDSEKELVIGEAKAFVEEMENKAVKSLEELQNTVSFVLSSGAIEAATRQAMIDYRKDFELLKAASHQLPQENLKALTLDYENTEDKEFSIATGFEDQICPYLKGFDGMANVWKEGSVVIGVEGSAAAVVGLINTTVVGGIPGLVAFSPKRIWDEKYRNSCRVFKESILVAETNATVSYGLTIGFSKNAPKDLHGPFFTGFAGVGDGIGVGASAFFSLPKNNNTEVSLIGIAFNIGLEVSALPAQVGIGIGLTHRLPAYMAVRYLATGSAW